jgi:hypothetical protein
VPDDPAAGRDAVLGGSMHALQRQRSVSRLEQRDENRLLRLSDDRHLELREHRVVALPRRARMLMHPIGVHHRPWTRVSVPTTPNVSCQFA